MKNLIFEVAIVDSDPQPTRPKSLKAQILEALIAVGAGLLVGNAIMAALSKPQTQPSSIHTTPAMCEVLPSQQVNQI